MLLIKSNILSYFRKSKRFFLLCIKLINKTILDNHSQTFMSKNMRIFPSRRCRCSRPIFKLRLYHFLDRIKLSQVFICRLSNIRRKFHFCFTFFPSFTALHLHYFARIPIISTPITASLNRCLCSTTLLQTCMDIR